MDQRLQLEPGGGRVASLHLHPTSAGLPLTEVRQIEVVAGMGIAGNPRYFGRISRSTGKPGKRQVTLIEREQVQAHAAQLGVGGIAPGKVRSNIETLGIDLVSLIGQEIEIGSAVLRLYAPRDPCEKMDAVCQGLREAMMHDRQGVLAMVVESGTIRIGDKITVRQNKPLGAQA